MPVIACNPENKFWYRAVILEREHRGFVVDLVDFGKKIKIQAHDMIPLPVQFFPIPAFSITCRINQVKQHSCSQEENKLFKEVSSCVGLLTQIVLICGLQFMLW